MKFNLMFNFYTSIEYERNGLFGMSSHCPPKGRSYKNSYYLIYQGDSMILRPI